MNAPVPRPDVSVVVPHYEDLASLEACLAALSRQTMPADRYEVIVADNRSPSGLAAVERVAAGRARVIDAPEKGAGPARNAGVAAARGALLAFTDCDCVPEPGWLAAGIARLGSADCVGGRMTVSVSDEARMSGAEAFERVFAFNNREYVEKKNFTATANLFCPRVVFDVVGPFHTGVSEDVDWCHRAAAKGYRLVYEPDAVVAHPARRDWHELKRKWQRMNFERFGLEARGAPGKLRWVARNLAMPLSIPAHAPRVLSSPALPDGRARLLALGTLARLRLWRMVDALSLLGRRARS